MNSSNDQFNEFIKNIEKQIEILKVSRLRYLSHQTSTEEYENLTENSISEIYRSADGIRRSYLPLTIPKCLLLSTEPPSWLNLSQNEKATYSRLAIESKDAQEMILRQFRRPGIRPLNANKVSALLNLEQHSSLDDYYMQQLMVCFNSIAARKRITPDQVEPNQALVSLIQDFITENDLEIPSDIDTLDLLLLALFDEEGPLSTGLPALQPNEEISYVASSLINTTKKLTYEDLVDELRPHIADLRQNTLILDIEKECETISASVSDAIDTISPEDSEQPLEYFGSSSILDVEIVQNLKEIHLSQGVQSLATEFDNVASMAIQKTESPYEAAIQIAGAILSTKKYHIVRNFFYSIQWCNGVRFRDMKSAPIFIQAFDLLQGLVKDF